MATTKTTTKRKSKKNMTLEERVRAAMVEEQKIYDKYGIDRKLVVNYPQTEKQPLIGRIGIKLLRVSGGILDIQFSDMWDNNK